MRVIVVVGSDARSYGVAHGVGLLCELELMERAGMHSVAVVNAATGAGAAHFAYRDAIGRIAPSRRSRVIPTRHSPADTVANLRKPRRVDFDGDVWAAKGQSHAPGM